MKHVTALTKVTPMETSANAPSEAKTPQGEEKPPFTPWSAISEGKGIFIPYKSELMELRDRGFGELRNERLFFTPYESFYLTEKQKIRVYNKKSEEELTLRDIVRKLSVGKPEIWIKYLVYRDLRDRGYIVRESERNFDFDTYGKGQIGRASCRERVCQYV